MKSIGHADERRSNQKYVELGTRTKVFEERVVVHVVDDLRRSVFVGLTPMIRFLRK